MRTTINLEDGLLRDAKRRASEAGTTLSGLIASALREMLNRSQRQERRTSFRLVTYGRKGVRRGVSLDRVHQILEEEEVSRLKRVSRVR
jgi:hypothetical protein